MFWLQMPVKIFSKLIRLESEKQSRDNGNDNDACVNFFRTGNNDLMISSGNKPLSSRQGGAVVPARRFGNTDGGNWKSIELSGPVGL